jgi:phage-related protein
VTPAEQIIKFSRFSVTFIVPDGVAYGAATDCTGVGTNAGAVACPVKITATFTANEANNYTITCGTESITINGPFLLNDVLVIENGYVTKNGSNNMTNVQVSSTFFKLPVGDFTVSDNSANAGMLLEWNALWL